MYNYFIRHFIYYIYVKLMMVNKMKVKIIDESHESDLESSVNKFLATLEGDVVDIKFSTAISMFGEEQIYCFTAMIIYTG